MAEYAELRDEVVGAWCQLGEAERDEIADIAPRLGQIFERLTCEVNTEFRPPKPSPPRWQCTRCGADRWVGWRRGPEHEGWPRKAQCVPCGHVQELPAEAHA